MKSKSSCLVLEPVKILLFFSSIRLPKILKGVQKIKIPLFSFIWGNFFLTNCIECLPRSSCGTAVPRGQKRPCVSKEAKFFMGNKVLK